MTERRFMLEGLMPCVDEWVQVRPPEWWNDETGIHDGLWPARSKQAVVERYLKLYPPKTLAPPAKPFREFRVAVPPQRFKVVPVA